MHPRDVRHVGERAYASAGFAVEDTAGNAIKVLGAKNVVFRDIRTEWTGPALPSNGAYGIYPVHVQVFKGMLRAIGREAR